MPKMCVRRSEEIPQKIHDKGKDLTVHLIRILAESLQLFKKQPLCTCSLALLHY